MKSETSSCKKTALRKDFGRFWPVWVGYTLFLGLLQIVQSNDDLRYWYAANLGECISVMGVVNGIVALVVAQRLFGDLFNTRMCNGIHALPLRREHWFSVHVKAGFLFSLIPTTLILGLSEGLIYQYSTMVDGWQLPLYWWLGANVQYIFFFGLAVFCIMCVGSKPAATIVYAIVNFASLLVYLLVDKLYTPLLRGVVTMSGPFEWLSPMYWIVNLRFIDSRRVEVGNVLTEEGTFEVVCEGWQYIAVLAVLGILLLMLAKRMYKKRSLESAGDFLAVRWLEAPFQVVFTVLCAAAFQGLFMLLFGLNSDYTYILLAVGLLIGWFTGRMFLERSTRIFRMKNILGFVLLAAVMAGSLFVTYLDPLGIETWVPRQGEVMSATLRMNYRQGHTTRDPEEMADIFRLHTLAIEQQVQVHPDYNDTYFNPHMSDPHAVQIIVQYETETGWLSQRNYYVLAEGESGQILRKYNSRLEAVFPQYDAHTAEDLYHEIRDTKGIMIHGLQLDAKYITPQFLQSLAHAIADDCEAGTMIQSGAFHTEPVITQPDETKSLYYLDVELHDAQYWGSFTVYADCENTMELLESTGILEDIRADLEAYYGG